MRRIPGIDTAGKAGREDFFIGELPWMFADWREYRDHLLDKLVTNPAGKQSWRKTFARHDRLYGKRVYADMMRVHVNSILLNDWEQIKLGNWERRPEIIDLRLKLKRKAGRWIQK